MSSARRFLLLCLLGASALVLGLAGPSGTARAATAPTWSTPTQITNSAPFAHTGTLTQITCADASDCFVGAVGQSATGVVYGTGDGGSTWSTQRGAGDDGGGPIACAPDLTAGATPFCLALSGDSVENLSAPGAPVTGPLTETLPLELAAALTCPSSGFCAAAGSFAGNGEVTSSTDPLTGAWTAVDADPGHPLVAISCPDAGLCVAVDDAGGVVSSTTPATGGWTRVAVGAGLDAVSCSSDGLCVAVSSAGAAYVSSDPAAGSWIAASVPGAGDLTGASCPVTGFCALSDVNGDVFTSSDPSGGSFTQAAALISELDGIDCPTAGTCFGLDGANVVTTTDVAGGTSTWTAHPVDAWNSLAAVSCPSAGLCVALQQNGTALSTTSPLTAGSAWSSAVADPNGTVVAVACPTTTACFGVDTYGRLLWSTAPASGVWKRLRLDLRGTPVGLSCPTASFCAFVDSAGRIFTSARPTGGASGWREVALEKPTTIRHQTVTLTSVTCSASAFCLVSDGNGRIFVSRTPRGAVSTWKVSQIFDSRAAGDYSLAESACPTSTDCVVLGTYQGDTNPSSYHPDAWGTYALTSTDPTGGAAKWKRRQIDNGYSESDASTTIAGLATGLSCPTTSLCAMVDQLGTAVTNISSAGSASWLTAAIDPEDSPDGSEGDPGLTGVSCFRGGHCVAVDGFGNRFVFGIGAGTLAPTPGITVST